MYSIGELAKVSSVTVRTLRYYDEIGILQPATISNGGHRYYGSDAMITLQYILTLKEIGFGLETIKSIMNNKEQTVKELLHMRLKIIESEQEELDRIRQKLERYIQLVDLSGEENWAEVLDMFKQYNFDWGSIEKERSKIFSEEEQRILEALPKVGEGKIMDEKWLNLVNDIRKTINEGNRPESSEGQTLAKRWSELVKDLYSGNMELTQKVWGTIQRSEEVSIGLVKFDEEVVEFIRRATEHAYFNGCDLYE